MPDSSTPTPTPSPTPSTGQNQQNTQNQQTTITTPSSNQEKTSNISGKIQLGFNLEGYTVKNKNQMATAGSGGTGMGEVGGGVGTGGVGGIGGTDVSWGGGLKDNRWVADTNLKQFQIEGTYYQSIPVAYKGDGEEEYAILSDGTGFVDGTGLKGGCAYGGCIYADCRLSSTSKFNAWSTENKRYNGGSDDYIVGIAFCWKTMVAYMQEFYNLTVTQHQVAELCRAKALNLEIVYNTGVEGQGKAYRVKCVDSSGNAGSQGTTNAVGKWSYEFDVVDTMSALLSLSAFAPVATWMNTKYGVFNSDQLYFPWKDATYDYRTGNIQGFSPSNILNRGWKDNGKTISILKGIGFKSMYNTARGHMIARGRFFGQDDLKDRAKQIIPGLSDEFFQTNYEQGGSAGMEMSQGGGVSGSIVTGGPAQQTMISASEQVAALAVQQAQAGQLKYTLNGSPIKPTGNANFPRYRMSSGSIDCVAFVRWVLLEAGFTDSTGVAMVKSIYWTADIINKSLKPGYKAVEITPDLSNAQKGDILIFGKGAHHGCVFSHMDGGRVMAWDMGNDSAVHGREGQPNSTYGQNKLIHIIRMCSTENSGTS